MDSEPPEATAGAPAEGADAAGDSALFEPVRVNVWTPVLLALAFVALYRITAWMPSEMTAVALSTIVALVLSLAFTVQSARAMRSKRAIAACLGVSALLVLPSVVVPVAASRFPTWSGWAAIGPRYGFYVHLLRLVPGVQMLLLVWFAVSVGALVSLLVRETKILLPMAVALAMVDLYVVFGGGLVTQATSTTKANQTAKVAMQSLTVRLPVKRPASGAQPMNLSVGVADYLFIALFFACFTRFGIPWKRTFAVLAVTLAGYMMIVFFTQTDLPALVPIAVVVVGMNLKYFRYERSEAFALLYAGIIVTAVLGGMIFYSHR